MLKKSIFLPLLAGMLVTLACAAPSRAGSVVVETFAAITPGNAGSSATGMSITYDGPVSGPLFDVVLTGGLSSSTLSFTGDVVTVNFHGAASNGTVEFEFTKLSPGVSVTTLNLSGVVNSSLTNPIGVKGGSEILPGVPEPTSIALLGIGMTGFLAFRRLFKRPTVA
jgi:hypothetical protein